LEKYGTIGSLAAEEERQNLGKLWMVREKFNEVVQEMLEEYRGLMS
jgi:hypothetical protein